MKSIESGKFVLRRTRTPESDIRQGWTALKNMYERNPFDLLPIRKIMRKEGTSYKDALRYALFRDHLEEVEPGVFHLKNTPEAFEAACKWCRKILKVDVRRTPLSGMYAVCRYEGLLCKPLQSATLEEAMAEASRLLPEEYGDWIDEEGDFLSLGSVDFWHVRNGWYVFLAEKVEAVAQTV